MYTRASVYVGALGIYQCLKAIKDFSSFWRREEFNKVLSSVEALRNDTAA